MVTDPLADMVIQIKNAQAVGKKSVALPYSQLKHQVAQVLQKEGFVGESRKKGKKIKKVLEVDLLYSDKTPKVAHVIRISKPSRRVYEDVRGLYRVAQKKGVAIVSTSKGITSAKEAIKQNTGGEVMMHIS